MILQMRKIPHNAIPRLSRYYRILVEQVHPWISSRELSEHTGFTAAQIRRDLGYFGQFGQPGKGYNIAELKRSLQTILGLDQKWNVALIGVGNLGAALLGYKGFREQGFNITAAFERDPSKIGKEINGVKIYPIRQFERVVRNNNIRMAILTVPRTEAQSVADLIARSGVKAVLNFAPVNLKLPDSVKVRNIDMTIEIERLSFLASRE